MPRQSITASQKASLRAHYASNPSLDHKALREWFLQTYHQRISQSSVSEILSTKYEYLDHPAQGTHLENTKRRRSECWPLLESALEQWLRARGSDQTPITTDLLRDKARYLFQEIPEYRGMSVPKFSSSWIEGFRARHPATPSRRSEANDRGVYVTDANPSLDRTRELEAFAAYQVQDHYVCVETSLYWKMLPESALTKVPASRLEAKRTRFSAWLCTNLDGSRRLPPWYIGRSPSPRAFGSSGVDIKDVNMIWKHNCAAKMTKSIFREFMCWFDTCVGDRKAVLWLDMFSARRAGFLTSDSISEFSQALGLGNVTVELVPPSHADTHRSQKQAVTAIWKTLYRRYWIQHVLDQLSARRNPLTTMNVRKAVTWATSAWNTDLGPQSIQTHFGRSSWLPGLSRKDPVYDDAHLREAKQYLQNAIRVLKQSSFIHKAMDIDAFINPPFESSENAWIDEEHIALGSNGSAVPEGDSDEEVE